MGFIRRHRKAAEDPNAMGGCTRCSFGFLVLLAQILLNGAMGLCLYWIVMFHANEQGQIFAWADGDNPAQVFNLHPVLMVAGFIYFMGQAMLMYRTCRCCRRIWNKLLHTVFHILAIPCIILGFIAVFDSHKLKDIPHFYSLHSWIGLTAMGLFAMQFIIGFFSFLLLLCCEKATASFRAALVPVHATFGLSTFVVAVAAACSGLTEKVFFTLSLAYSKWVPYFVENGFESEGALENLSTLGPNYRLDYAVQALVINCLGACLILLAIVIPCILGVPNFRYRSQQRIITVTQEHYS